jgi:chitinase
MRRLSQTTRAASVLTAFTVPATASLLIAEDVQVRFIVESSYDGGYNASIDLTNQGSEAVSSWTLAYRDGPTIETLWNADWLVNGDQTTLSNLDWNGTILPGETRSIGFGGSGVLEQNVRDATFNGQPVDVLYEGSTDGGGGDGDGGGGGGEPVDPDFNGDGLVDGADLSLLLSGWGGNDIAVDLDGDGLVGGNDLAMLLGAWGLVGGGGGDDGGNGDGDSGPQTDKKIVAYYIEWGIYGRDYQPADMPLEKVTHVNYAFANISADGRIAIGDPYAATEKLYPGDSWDQPYAGTYNQLNNVLRAEHPHIKTLISVGGWTWSGRFSDVALTEQSRALFAESCVQFIRDYNFDGVDLDWEYPVEGGLGSNIRRPEDGVNYTLLLREVRRQLDIAEIEDGSEYLLTIASPAGWDKVRHLEIAELSDVLDWVNVMTYDFRGSWDLSSTAHHSGMYENPADPIDGNSVAERYNVNWAVQEFLAQGMEPSKLVVGVPFYSRAWGGVQDPLGNGGLYQPASSVPPGTWDDGSSGATGVNDFFEIEEMIASGAYTRYWDSIAQVPYLYSSTRYGGHFVSYDDEESMGIKLDYVLENELGGAMFWEITADRNETLLDVIIESLESVAP